MNKYLLIMISGLLTIQVSAQKKDYNILTYGAKANKNFKNTLAIQQAIDAANKGGGGRVLIPDGNFVTGPFVLRSNVDLHLADNAVLLGSVNRLDYPRNGSLALIYANNQQNIAITGTGVINGQGRELVENVLDLLSKGIITDPQWKVKRPTEKNRPVIILFDNCTDIKVKGITLKDAAGWVQNYNRCKNVLIDSMIVQSTAYWNNDGIDITDTKNVKITNSTFNAADDAICLKSEYPEGACEDVVVENCILRSSASGFKLGTGSVGGFKRIKVNNLTVYNTYRSAIALETVDGAVLEDIDIRNVTATNVGNAIFLRLGHRNTNSRYSTLKRVYIANVKAAIPAGKPDIGYPVEGPPPKVPAHNVVPSSITGLPGHPVEDVVLENIEISYAGGASREIAEVTADNLSSVTENTAGYPEFTMFGELPAWGLYVRHAKGITLKNVKLTVANADFRPAIVFDDANTINLQKVAIPTVNQTPAVILNKVNAYTLKDTQIPGDVKVMVKVQ
ncbi:glycoside hydrolase family 28 protein [Mucilaginibacter phyllosphaerae]|uniref:Glycoside hydrolase family 28 n=1 Tax=Mucilaginibacter phyllosphaerae TaxID=1812349 RepID=A0A4Y8AJN4_9SPHI|nr:glycosyl hydrolase family 28 protein [Mucilaginibacter phyllosphaerae]MBB3967706.1 polygalacturonase [Mucilaginibacter phyllosphaerae]TEW69240.1 glycoside hydrolase family 28 [Mucilaginibacter phyllosphaerae]GGH03866.1 exo-poly-alpha-D-galacturonosidase [Mucilaginibacter phyllosphaerae]